MSDQHPPANLEAVCGFTATGPARSHICAPVEYLGIRSCAAGRLRLRLRVCFVCSAFQLTSLGGDSDVLEELLEFTRPIPLISGWISHEKPGYEHVADRLPERRMRGSRKGAA